MTVRQNKEAQISSLASLNKSSSICLYSVSKFDRLNYISRKLGKFDLHKAQRLASFNSPLQQAMVALQNLNTSSPSNFGSWMPADPYAPLVSPSSLSIQFLYLSNLASVSTLYLSPAIILIFLMLQYGFEEVLFTPSLVLNYRG